MTVSRTLLGRTIEQVQHVPVKLTGQLIDAPDQNALRRQVRHELGERHGVVAYAE